MKEPTVETARTPGERIRAAYLAKGWSRADLQRALGCAYTTIIAWEEDRSVPERYLNQLSVVLGVSTSFILGEDEPVTEPQYKAWGRFLETEAGRGMTPAERRTLASMHFDEGLGTPTVERYRALLLALRMSASAA